MTALGQPILFNSTSGSDTQSSGSSAGANVYGSGASTTSGSAVVTGITTTGVQSGDLFWVQSSSGRQFSVIASVGSGQVTCDDTFANTESSRSWAIGGKRATLAGSSELYDRSGSDGDAKAGHILELEDGYTETLSSTINLRVAYSGTQGLTVRGALDATTKPVLTFTNNGTGFYCHDSYQLIQNMELKNSSATKTSCIAVNVASHATSTHLDLLDIHDPTDYWNHAFYCFASGNTGVIISRCSVGNCGSVGIYPRVSAYNVMVYKCVVFNCGGGGFRNAHFNKIFMTNNLFYNNSSFGAYFDDGDGIISGNVFYNNGTDSIKADRNALLNFTNNIIVGTTNGINITASAYENTNIFDHNAFYNCTNNTVNIESATNDITLTADPFVSASTGDFNLNSDSGGGATLRANNFSINTDTSVYPFRQYVSDDFDSGAGGGATIHPLYAN